MCFRRVMDEYPESEIHGSYSHSEQGMTASKCRYGAIHCLYKLGERSEAQDLLEVLEQDESSGVNIEGVFVSYAQLAKRLVHAHSDSSTPSK